ncbi:hypothetical protein HCN44_006015 [Aphidius gifuensis]|uniref:UBP-type domain-containing protein n=1 Tax=Aphidius gifuensis TaxID=684658 RepID=A0A835CVP2_APHGI|nr:hypothetical protein HCN44_006015 [Aphidius gifuensis]
MLPNFTSMIYPSVDLPEQITGILEAESAIKIAEREALAGTWGVYYVDVNFLMVLVVMINDHVIKHYRTTGYPLAVKLGTITKKGNGDVYSYDENDMGISISNMDKTEKSMVELELDLNQKFGEWVALQEASSKLIPIYGAGYTGLNNLGNLCYLNFDESVNIFNDNYNDPANNFDTQISKLDYNRQGISPRMFENLISRGHPGFSSNLEEYSSSGKVKYSYRPEYLLPLPIPLNSAINKDEVNTYENDKKAAELNGQSFDRNNTIIRPHIKLSSCLESCLYLLKKQHSLFFYNNKPRWHKNQRVKEKKINKYQFHVITIVQLRNNIQ